MYTYSLYMYMYEVYAYGPTMNTLAHTSFSKQKHTNILHIIIHMLYITYMYMYNTLHSLPRQLGLCQIQVYIQSKAI